MWHCRQLIYIVYLCFNFSLIFSQSLLSLDLIEDFLSFWHEAITQKAAEANDGEVNLLSCISEKVFLLEYELFLTLSDARSYSIPNATWNRSQ